MTQTTENPQIAEVRQLIRKLELHLDVVDDNIAASQRDIEAVIGNDYKSASLKAFSRERLEKSRAEQQSLLDQLQAQRKILSELESPSDNLADVLARRIRTVRMKNSKTIHLMKWADDAALCHYKPPYSSEGFKDAGPDAKANCDRCLHEQARLQPVTLPDEAPVVEPPAEVERWDIMHHFSNKTIEQKLPVLHEMVLTKLIKGSKTCAQLSEYSPSCPALVDRAIRELEAEGRIRTGENFVIHLVRPEEVKEKINVLHAKLMHKSGVSPTEWTDLTEQLKQLRSVLSAISPTADEFFATLGAASKPAGKPLVIEVSAEQWAKGNKKKTKKPKASSALRSDFTPDEFSQAVLELLGRWPHKLTSGSIALNLQGAPWFFDVAAEHMLRLISPMIVAGLIESYTSSGHEFYRLPTPAEVVTLPATEPEPVAPARSTWWDEIIDSADLTDEQVQFRISEPDLARQFLAYIADVRPQDMAMALDEILSACPVLAAEAFSTYAHLLDAEDIEPLTARVEKIIDETSAKRLLQEVALLEDQDTQEEAITNVIAEVEETWETWKPFSDMDWTAVLHCRTGLAFLVAPGHQWKGKPDRWCARIGNGYKFSGLSLVLDEMLQNDDLPDFSEKKSA